MAWGSVKARGPDGEDVYINGNYEEAAGKTNTDLAVEYGALTVETLDDSGQVELRAETTVDDDHTHVEVDLAPVR